VVAETVQESTGVITSRRVDAHLCLVSHHQLILPQRPAQNVMSFFNTATSTTAALSDKDIEVADPPPDSISSLTFSPQADYLAVGSWDNNVRVILACAPIR
jgi:WD40 repeat protein